MRRLDHSCRVPPTAGTRHLHGSSLNGLKMWLWGCVEYEYRRAAIPALGTEARQATGTASVFDFFLRGGGLPSVSVRSHVPRITIGSARASTPCDAIVHRLMLLLAGAGNLLSSRLLLQARDMIDRARRISLHEASHAVCARRLGLPDCGGATIIEPNAHAVFPCNRGFPSIYTLMAGSAAEVVAFGDFDRVGVKTDRARWTKRLALFGHGDASACWQLTLDFVRDNIDLISFVADQLERERTLSGGFIDGAVRRW